MKKVMVLFFLVLLAVPSVQMKAQEKLKAKIGVMLVSGEEARRMKRNDRAFAGDAFRVFVEPLSDAHVYVVLNEGEKATLLSREAASSMVDAAETYVLPVEDELFYEIDDQHESIRLTVICSRTMLDDVEALFAEGDEADAAAWDDTAGSLEDDTEAELGGVSDKPLIIAGNVRSANQDFLQRLRRFTGEEMIMMTYDVSVKN